jgi:chromosomal replication initiator protein
MLDCVTEIPLPGRILSTTSGPARAARPPDPMPAFVAGPENRLVASTIDRLLHLETSSEGPGDPFAPSLLVLFGPSGTGKSHLATGLYRHWQAQHGDDSAVYTTAADFRHLLNDAIKRQAELAFRSQFRGRSLLVIDDLQNLPPDDYAWQEFRYTLDEYEGRDACVIVTANEPINSLANIPLDIRSRLARGLALHLAHPGNAARVQIIRHAACAIGRPIAQDIAEHLARGIEGGANELFRALFELAANSNDLTKTEQADELLANRAARRPTIREITAVVARRQNVPQAQLKSSSRKQSVVFARGLVVFLARDLADATYDEIGRALGGRDHTTVIHNYRKIDDLRQSDQATALTLEELRRILLSR